MEGKELIARIDAFVERYGPMLEGASPEEGGAVEPDPILWMNGTDHQVPMPWLGHVVDEANREQDRYELRVGSLAEHLAGAPTEGLPTWRGELRSGAHANLLMGVASNRTDVRRAAATAERSLEARCEPLWSLFQPADRWPATLLSEAWGHVIHNAAHDSICACSVDEVCDAVLHRYAEAVAIGDGLAKRAVDRFAMTLAHEGSVVVNPSARPRGGTVAVVVAGEDDVPGTQRLRVWAADGHLGTFPRAEARHMAPRIIDELGAHTFTIEATDEGALVVVTVDDASRVPASFPVQDLDALLADRGDAALVEVRVRQAPKQQVLTRVEAVPGYGWQAVCVPAAPTNPVAVVDGHTLANGLVTVVVDPADGTFAVDGHAGLGRLVDGGDVGDTYNYCTPAVDREGDTPVSVAVRVIEEGPVRAALEVLRTYRWPAAAVGLDARTDDEVEAEVTTRIELHADEAFVRVTTTFDNTARDHRLRAWFPLPERTATSRAECAFAVVERGLTAEGGDSELGLPTYPSRRFVQAGGLTVAHEGLLEYELVDLDDAGAPTSAGALAVTLLRCTGMLSQGPMPYRPLPAGPLTPLEGSQQRGPQTMRYAVAAGDVDPYALVDDAFLALMVGRARGVGEREDTGQLLSVEGAPVSSLRRHDGRLELRVFNPGTEPTEVRVEGRTGWQLDLKGTPLAPFDETVELPPGRITTLALTQSLPPTDPPPS
ncbi:MAG TPA: glycoside hydrolase family 38 C-terminal domain-containing protein, partial [Acidimicrobiales bacterium]|nr:glycoside hydrolase family 38 C-terminal domain-containing protein [Acidimicrobiales bacterium]